MKVLLKSAKNSSFLSKIYWEIYYVLRKSLKSNWQKGVIYFDKFGRYNQMNVENLGSPKSLEKIEDKPDKLDIIGFMIKAKSLNSKYYVIERHSLWSPRKLRLS